MMLWFTMMNANLLRLTFLHQASGRPAVLHMLPQPRTSRHAHVLLSFQELPMSSTRLQESRSWKVGLRPGALMSAREQGIV